MRQITVLLCAVLILALAGGVVAEDGDDWGTDNQQPVVIRPRAGFVCGMGIGVSPMTKWSTQYYEEEHMAIPIQFLIGFAGNEHSVIGYEMILNLFHSDYYSGTKQQGFAGFSWHYYPGPTGRSFFTVLGCGVELSNTPRGSSGTGFGLLGGLGAEFQQYLQGGIYLNYGLSADPDINRFNLSLLLSAMIY